MELFHRDVYLYHLDNSIVYNDSEFLFSSFQALFPVKLGTEEKTLPNLSNFTLRSFGSHHSACDKLHIPSKKDRGSLLDHVTLASEPRMDLANLNALSVLGFDNLSPK